MQSISTKYATMPVPQKHTAQQNPTRHIQAGTKVASPRASHTLPIIPRFLGSVRFRILFQAPPPASLVVVTGYCGWIFSELATRISQSVNRASPDRRRLFAAV